MKSPFKEILIAFLIGGLVGAFAAARFLDRPEIDRKGRLMEKFSHELKLTPDQDVKIKAIFESKRSQFKALREEMRPRFDQIRNSSRSEIEKILTAEQLPVFQKMEADWQVRRKDRLGKRRMD